MRRELLFDKTFTLVFSTLLSGDGDRAYPGVGGISNEVSMAKAREGFAKIERAHVEEACRLLVKGGAGGGGGSYFVRFDGNDLPAKRVLREAYQRANQSEIGAKEFSGGQYTARILQRLGFEVVVR